MESKKLKETFTLERQYELDQYHKVKLAIGNTLKTMKMSLLENLQNDPNDSGVIIPNCFALVDCDIVTDLDHRMIIMLMQFKCDDPAIVDMVIKNADRICIGYYMNNGNPTFEILWNRFGDFVKLQNLEQDGETDEYQ